MPSVLAAIGEQLSEEAIIAAVENAIITAVASYALGKISQLLAGNPSDKTGAPSQTLTVQSTLEPARIIYGQVLTAGVLDFVAASATSSVGDIGWSVFTSPSPDVGADALIWELQC